MTRRSQVFTLSLWLLAIAINATALFLVVPRVSARLHPAYNQDEYADGYDELAANLAAGDGFRVYPDTALTLGREPGYPVLLAGIFLVFGQNFLIVKLVNLVLAIAAAVALARLARTIAHDSTVGLIAPLLFLVHPGTIVAESRGAVEVLFTFLLVAFMLTVYRAVHRGTIKEFAFSGAVLGLTVLVKGTPMLFPAVLLVYLWIYGSAGPRLMAVAQIATMVAAMLLVLSPWIIRNYRLTGKFMPTASVLGISAHAGWYISTHLGSDQNWAKVDRAAAVERRRIAQQLGYGFKPVEHAYYQDFYATADELQFSHYLFQMVKSEYERSPGLFIRHFTANLFNIWFRGKTWNATRLNLIVQLPYLLCALAGIAVSVARRRWQELLPLLLFLGYVISVYAAILAQARYSVPLIPFVSLLAGIALAAVLRRQRAGDLEAAGQATTVASGAQG